MIEIEVRNFQSIEHAAIRIEGFAALVGRSNIGKSALVRAVRAALTGAPVTTFVRHSISCPRRLRSAKSCGCVTTVRIKTDGFDLFWEKGDTVNRYTFNGTIYDKVAQGTPDFLQEFFAPVKVGESKTLIQVADQFAPIFLLDQTGTVVADVLSDVARLDRINVAMRNAEKDRREAASTRKVREKDVVDLEAALVSYDGLDGVIERTESTQKRFEQVQLAHGKVAQIECYNRAMQTLERDAGALETATAPPLPDIGLVFDQHVAQVKLAQFYQRLAERAVAIRGLAGVESVVIPVIGPVQVSSEMLGRLITWTNGMYDFQRWFDHRKDADKVVLSPLAPILDAAKRFEGLSKFAQGVSGLAKTVATLEAEFIKAEQMASEIRQEFESLGVCPTCSQSVHLTPH